eukprot:403348740
MQTTKYLMQSGLVFVSSAFVYKKYAHNFTHQIPYNRFRYSVNAQQYLQNLIPNQLLRNVIVAEAEAQQDYSPTQVKLEIPEVVINQDSKSSVGDYLNQKSFDSQRHNHFHGAYTNIPHIDKRHRGGEDAWIFTSNLLAVADGVGGWNSKGVDPGIFARELCSHVQTIFFDKLINSTGSNGEENKEAIVDVRVMDINLIEVLCEGVRRTQARGTSTFVLTSIDQQSQVINGLNLGDSAYMIVRPDPNEESGFQVLFRSKEQQYRFNYPYQCGTNYDLPTHADLNQHPVQHNDLIVLGTDGVFDNLYDKDVLKCLKPEVDYTNESNAASPTYSSQYDLYNLIRPQEASNCLANTAEKLSYDKTYDSPFSVGARAAGRSHRIGGKDDDITVIVAQIKIPNMI